VKLEHGFAGGRIYTSVEAMDRFLRRRAEVRETIRENRVVSRPRRAIIREHVEAEDDRRRARAMAVLERAGIHRPASN